MAQKLMTKYNLTMVEMDKVIMNGDYTEDVAVMCNRKSMEDKYVGSILTKFFNVKIIWTSGGINLFGKEAHIAVGKVIYTFLRRTYRSLWHEYYYGKPKHVRDIREKNSYYCGLTLGLAEKLKEQREESMQENPDVGNALMVINKTLEKKYKEINPHNRAVKLNYGRYNHGATEQGKADGRTIQINSFLSENNSSPKVLN